MVQVDVCWGYAWGASLAAAAGRPLAQSKKPFETKYFVATIAFLALAWAPTGMLLLLRHPSWETMQAAGHFSDLSEWLVLAFGFTNVTQGILGFWVGQRLLARGHDHLAELNWISGYFGMFFILLYGWDGLGYDRFLYDRDMLPGSPAWHAGAATGTGALAALGRFFGSSVAMTLYTDGVILLPPFFWLATRWAREAGSSTSALKVIARYLGGVFLVGFAAAAVCALTVRVVGYGLGVGDHVARAMGEVPKATGAHIASYFIGLPLGVALLWWTVLAPGRVVQRLLRPLPSAG
jgi:hypothetical protein